MKLADYHLGSTFNFIIFNLSVFNLWILTKISFPLMNLRLDSLIPCFSSFFFISGYNFLICELCENTSIYRPTLLALLCHNSSRPLWLIKRNSDTKKVGRCWSKMSSPSTTSSLNMQLPTIITHQRCRCRCMLIDKCLCLFLCPLYNLQLCTIKDDKVECWLMIDGRGSVGVRSEGQSTRQKKKIKINLILLLIKCVNFKRLWKFH